VVSNRDVVNRDTPCNNVENLKNILSESSLLAYTHLELHIRNHLYSFFPSNSRFPRSRVLRQKPPPPPWWNEECLMAVNERKEAISKYLDRLLLTLPHTKMSDQDVQKPSRNRKGSDGKNTVHNSIIKLPLQTYGASLKTLKKGNLLNLQFFLTRAHSSNSSTILLLSCAHPHVYTLCGVHSNL